MNKFQYITDSDQEKKALILPIYDYEETFHSNIKSATLSAVNVAFDLLKLPKKVRKFVDSLIRLRGTDWEFEVLLTDKKISKITKCSISTIKNHRKALKEYVECEGGKAIVDYEQKMNDNHQQIGTIYKLNILQSVFEAIRDFTKEKNIDLKEFCAIAKQLNTFDLEERKTYNSPFRELIDCIELHLQKLPDQADIRQSEITEGAIRMCTDW